MTLWLVVLILRSRPVISLKRLFAKDDAFSYCERSGIAWFGLRVVLY